MEFASAGDYVDTGSSLVNLGTAFTISIWIKPASGFGGNDNFCGTYNTGGWLFRTGVSDASKIEFYDGLNQHVTANSYLIANTWSHVSVTLQNSLYSIYHNGVLVYGPTAGQASPLTTGAGNFYIGSIPLLPGTYGFPGQEDDLRIYSRSLSAAEIQALALSRSRIIITDGLASWWKLDDGIDGAIASGSNTIRDSSGGGAHGTPSNNPIWKASSWINYP